MIGSVKLSVSLTPCQRLKWEGELGKINKSIKQLNTGRRRERKGPEEGKGDVRAVTGDVWEGVCVFLPSQTRDSFPRY